MILKFFDASTSGANAEGVTLNVFPCFRTEPQLELLSLKAWLCDCLTFKLSEGHHCCDVPIPLDKHYKTTISVSQISINQSINQSISQSVSQSVNQSINQSKNLKWST